MRVLIISFFNSWITHFGTELEIAQRHIDDGDEVTMLGCDGAITCCDANPLGGKETCTKCLDNRYAGLELLTKKIKLYKLGAYLSKEASRQAQAIAESIHGPEDACKLSIFETDLGWGALSSTISRFRDPDCKSDESLTQLRKFCVSAVRSFSATQRFLQSHPEFDCVYIFNGRYASTRGAFRAVLQHGTSSIFLHERGSSINRYHLFKNDFPHSRSLLMSEANRLWNQEVSEESRQETASRFYRDRRFGKPTGWKSFTELQMVGQLPDSWDTKKKNIVIFNSSEDEFASIGKEWLHPIYPRQSIGIPRIVTDICRRETNTRVYLRIHPNLLKVKNNDLKTILDFKHPQLETVLPDSPVCSYAMLDHSHCVLTFGSTMGAEATFWRKPSVLASHAFYEDFDVAYQPRSHEELIDMLSTDLVPKPIDGARKYGYYMNSFGTEYKYWVPQTFESGTYRTRRVYPEFSNPLLKGLIRFTYDKPLLRKWLSSVGTSLRRIKESIKKRPDADLEDES